MKLDVTRTADGSTTMLCAVAHAGSGAESALAAWIDCGRVHKAAQAKLCTLADDVSLADAGLPGPPRPADHLQVLRARHRPHALPQAAQDDPPRWQVDACTARKCVSVPPARCICYEQDHRGS